MARLFWRALLLASACASKQWSGPLQDTKCNVETVEEANQVRKDYEKEYVNRPVCVTGTTTFHLGRTYECNVLSIIPRQSGWQMPILENGWWGRKWGRGRMQYLTSVSNYASLRLRYLTESIWLVSHEHRGGPHHHRAGTYSSLNFLVHLQQQITYESINRKRRPLPRQQLSVRTKIIHHFGSTYAPIFLRIPIIM